MKKGTLALLTIILLASCGQKKEFDAAGFLALCGQYHLLNENEEAVAGITLSTIPQPDVWSAARVCKKVNFQTSTAKLHLDTVNVDSNFNFLKYFREQLSQRSKPHPKGAVFIHNVDSAKEQYSLFLRVLHEKRDLTGTQYAKIMELLKREPVVYPFVIFEWIETTP